MAPNTSQVQEMEREMKDSLFAGRQLASAPQGEEVCITGISGLFPDSDGMLELQENLFNKRDLVTADIRRWNLVHPEIPPRTGKLNKIQKFDASFFGIHFKQAHALDPMSRGLLETSIEAVLDAGMNPTELQGSRTGVFIGSCFSESEKTWFYENLAPDGIGILGCSRPMLANRISFWLGLNGPSYTVDSACSSSLYALDHAYKAIRDGVCDQALVGGANLCLHPYVSLQFSRLGVLSPQGRCKSFDAQANGYARSETIGVMLLQKSKDARRIYSTVVHVKTNCDGYKQEGITYPSGEMQQKLLQDFYQECEIDPASIAWVEAHGTGTRVGDPEELQALDAVFCKGRTTPLPIGSIKSNLGHTEPASGLCSIAKVIIAMETSCIPPNLHYELPREGVSALLNGHIQVVTEPQKWKGGLVGVNSFGFGGANCHALLKWNPKNQINDGAPDDNIPRLVTISARTEKGVQKMLDDLESRPLNAEYVHLYHKINAYRIPGYFYRGYTLLKGDKSIRDIKECVENQQPPIWFVFSGLDSQWIGMGCSLLVLPPFSKVIDKCHHILKPLGLNLKKVITEDKFDSIIHTMVGITAIQIGLLEVLKAVKILPDGLVGLSFGELAAGFADGCLTLEQTILVSYYQGLSLLELDPVKGSMAYTAIGSSEIKSVLPSDVEVAYKNGPGSCIVSGPSDSVGKLLKSLKSKGVAANEIKCNNIAIHSRCIKDVGLKLRKYLNKIIPTPKNRSNKWISTSVSKSELSIEVAKVASSEYITNSILHPVFSDNAVSHIPSNAVLIEISPDATLSRTMTKLGGQVSLSLMDSKHDCLEHLLLTLGKLFMFGLQPQLGNLYPPVSYPVSRATPMISPLVEWEHSHDWFITKYVANEQFKSGEKDVLIDVSNEDMAFYTGHVIDGRNLFPATGYLVLVWETFAAMNDCNINNFSVMFENIRFNRATHIPKHGIVSFVILVQKGSGNFEVVESDTAVVTGRIYRVDDPAKEMVQLSRVEPTQGSDLIDLTSKDVYKELRLRGYQYSGLFRSIISADNLGLTGKIQWQDNWITFMDNMLQMKIFSEDTRGLFVPTSLDKLIINAPEHMSLVKAMDDVEVKAFDVFVHSELEVISAGGIQVKGLKASPISRRKPRVDPVLEKYLFVPNTNFVDKNNINYKLDALRVCIHVILENHLSVKVKVIEVMDSQAATVKKSPLLAPTVAAILGDLPLLQADITVLGDINSPLVTDLDSTIKVEDKKLSTEQNILFVIGTGMLNCADTLQAALSCTGPNGYVISRENVHSPTVQEAGIHILNEYNVEDEKLVLLKKDVPVKECTVMHIKDNSFEWVPQLQKMLKDGTGGPTILLVSESETSGILGLFNCLRKEAGGQSLRCYLILDSSAPPFSITLPFYQDQIKKDLAMNVYKSGQWGSFRHLVLEPFSMVDAKHAYINIDTRGDLSTLHWFEGSLDPESYKTKEDQVIVYPYYAALNFRDVMTATGKLAIEVLAKSRIRQQNVQGLEYSGRDSNGRRVMGEIECGAMSTAVVADTSLLWEVPDAWTLEDAATVPVVYATAYYALFLNGNMKKGDSVLIHAGTGGVGQAAIQLALHEGCTVYTTVGTSEKRAFIKDRFPQLTDRNIGNSRDTSFEQLVMTETNGQGVDLVLNSLAGEKLQASVRCLARGGRFLEIGKFDLANNTALGMDIFLKEISFHGVMLDNLFSATAEEKKPLHDIMTKGIKEGAVKPLVRTVFSDDEPEKAFRYMAAGKHIGKVLLKIHDEEKDTLSHSKVLCHKAKPHFFCNPEYTYVIAGGLGGFGLELADWLVLRGALKLVLTSRRGIKTGYQSSRVQTWRSYGVTVHIAMEDITTREGVISLLMEANRLGPVGGIFNLAVVLQDALFENQTEEHFKISFGAKVEATKHFDIVSRRLCPYLKQFVTFSSVSCGRGNLGQTNYGMANSVMERICESRMLEGFPGLAVQWGAIGDVGLVADMQEENQEVVIGGTLPQRITSCLEVMDIFLHQSNPVVASMLVAEKKTGGVGSGNIVDCIANIIGLRDLKTVSLHSNLAELGMDSMMVVEIKQTLEQEFELFLTPQDIRGLTFAKLIDLANSDASDNKPPNNDLNIDAAQFMLRAIGNENDSSEPTVFLPSLSATSSEMFLIPGIEGTANIFVHLAKHLNHRAVCLQLAHWNSNLTEQMSELAALLVPFVKKSLHSITEPFKLVGHSFGGLVAMFIALELETAGYHGKLFLLDSAPDFLRAVAQSQFGPDGTDDTLQISLLLTILKLLQKSDIEFFTQVQMNLAKLHSWEERVDHFLTLVPDSTHSHNYRKILANSALKRMRAVFSFSWPSETKLKSSVTLIRPTTKVLQCAEDYGLGKYCEGPIDVHYAEGDHATFLDNPLVANIINTQSSRFMEEIKFKHSVGQTPLIGLTGFSSNAHLKRIYE